MRLRDLLTMRAFPCPRHFRHQSVDMWALGCLTYIVLFGGFPFYNDEDDRGKTVRSLKDKIREGKYDFPTGNEPGANGTPRENVDRGQARPLEPGHGAGAWRWPPPSLFQKRLEPGQGAGAGRWPPGQGAGAWR